MRYTNILIDLDDTLIDTMGNTHETLNEIYTDYHLDAYFPSFEDFYKIYYINVSKLWEMYSKGEVSKEKLQRDRFSVPLASVSQISEKQVLEMNDDFISRIMLKKKLIKGTIEVLEHLTQRYKIHVLSNGFTEMQYKKMDSAGLTSYFTHVVLSDKVGVNKPHPALFTYTLNKIGAKPAECIMIGDNLFADIKGAKDSGIDQIWFNPNHKTAEGLKPTYTIKDLIEIKNIL